MQIPDEDLHRIADTRFNHFCFNFFNGKLLYIHHAVDFFKGTPSPWNPRVYDDILDDLIARHAAKEGV